MPTDPPPASTGAAVVTEVTARGATVWLSREMWGLVIDALIEHQQSALTRHAGNAASSSDERARDCGDLIGLIGVALQDVPR